MKKMILSVALFIATFGVANANIQKKNYRLDQVKVSSAVDVVRMNTETPNIISFYDVERIVIKNDNNVLIRVYDNNWKLIKETRGNLNLRVIPGNYYVACERKIKTKYVSFN